MQWAADVCQSPFCMWGMREQFCCSCIRWITSSPVNMPYGKAISCHNASSKMEIPTLLVFDLLIMHISRELTRRLLCKMHRERCFLTGKPTVSDSTPMCNPLEELRSVESDQSPLTLFRVTWSPFSRAIVVDRTSPSQMAQ